MSILPSLIQRRCSTFRNLEIRLDTPVVSLNGHSQQDSTRVRGRIVFMNSSNLRVKSVTASISGTQQVLWYTDTMTSDRIRNKDVFFLEHTSLLSTGREPSSQKSCLLTPGNHVWQFDFDLKSCLYESIEGLGDSFVTYEVRATIVVAGKFSKKICAKKQVKVVRDSRQAEVDDFEPEQDDHRIWSEKLSYHMVVSPQNHRWGDPITATFELTPLAKGIVVESIALRLQESLQLKAPSKNRDLYHRRHSMISEIEATKTENTALLLQTAAAAWENQLEMVLPLPRSLQVCRQSVNQDRIKVFHTLLIDLRARDKEGVAYHGSHQFPFILSFPSGVTFTDNGIAFIPCEPTHLQQDAQGLTTGFCLPPAFGSHSGDPIFRPGLALHPSEPRTKQFVCGLSDGPYQRVTLCTKPLSRFTFPTGGNFARCVDSRRFCTNLADYLSDSHPGPLYPICLDCVPSYDTALQTPEIYTNDFDPSPAYPIGARNL
ncbi:carbon catabolite repression protein [Stagonosporopsis vannaccii]|nr:carbon catabolite repression protein [Stagonosporopsis vannaccii]